MREEDRKVLDLDVGRERNKLEKGQDGEEAWLSEDMWLLFKSLEAVPSLMIRTNGFRFSWFFLTPSKIECIFKF